ncbi:translation initiation factor IF-2-like isoform X1 [Lagopus leucura]|uniref:translation initiation factor IF-2-like isoform X1 n=1 Tax=Lagopus leucura TaxID=30410 RepID=UPI001C663E6A|nr:translation initiation factor IF-2-like isoform X1 [Lagopus leucura]
MPASLGMQGRPARLQAGRGGGRQPGGGYRRPLCGPGHSSTELKPEKSSPREALTPLSPSTGAKPAVLLPNRRHAAPETGKRRQGTAWNSWDPTRCGAPMPAGPTACQPPPRCRRSRPTKRSVPPGGPAAAQCHDLPMACSKMAPKKGRKPGAGEPGSRDPPALLCWAASGRLKAAGFAPRDPTGLRMWGWGSHLAQYPLQKGCRRLQTEAGCCLRRAGKGAKGLFDPAQTGSRAGSSNSRHTQRPKLCQLLTDLHFYHTEELLILSEPPASRPRPDSALTSPPASAAHRSQTQLPQPQSPPQESQPPAQGPQSTEGKPRRAQPHGIGSCSPRAAPSSLSSRQTGWQNAPSPAAERLLTTGSRGSARSCYVQDRGTLRASR